MAGSLMSCPVEKQRQRLEKQMAIQRVATVTTKKVCLCGENVAASRRHGAYPPGDHHLGRLSELCFLCGRVLMGSTIRQALSVDDVGTNADRCVLGP
jgi:hypothetical protein